MTKQEQNDLRNQLAKQLYEHLKSRKKFTLRNRLDAAPKTGRIWFLGEMNEPQKFQDDVWSGGAAQIEHMVLTPNHASSFWHFFVDFPESRRHILAVSVGQMREDPR